MARRDVQARVREIAERTLGEQHYVSPLDVLLGLGWLAPPHLDQWRQGRVPYLECVVQANLGKVSTAMTELRRWARARHLVASETGYVARTRDRRPLRFSAGNDPNIESAYRTHWVSPELSERHRERITERQSRPPDLLVISASKPWACTNCAAAFGAGAFLMMEDGGPICLDCADLGHLEYLPAGNAALTRRARKASPLSAVVVRWSRTRKRYERQGLLAVPDAIEQAEAQCRPNEASPGSVVVAAAADRPASRSGERQDCADQQHDDADGPQDRDREDESDNEKDDAENDHRGFFR